MNYACPFKYLLLNTALTNEKVGTLDCARAFRIGFSEDGEEEESFQTSCSDTIVPFPCGGSHPVSRDVRTDTSRSHGRAAL